MITDSLRFLVATANMRTSPLCLHVGFCDDPEIASLEPWFLCHQASPDTSQPFTGACVRLCQCYLLHHVLSPSVSEHHPTGFHPQMGASALMTQSQTVEKGKVACQGLQQTAQQMLQAAGRKGQSQLSSATAKCFPYCPQFAFGQTM